MKNKKNSVNYSKTQSKYRARNTSDSDNKRVTNSYPNNLNIKKKIQYFISHVLTNNNSRTNDSKIRCLHYAKKEQQNKIATTFLIMYLVNKTIIMVVS